VWEANDVKISVWFGKTSRHLEMNEKSLFSFSDLLDNKKQTILRTIQNSEELLEGAIE